MRVLMITTPDLAYESGSSHFVHYLTLHLVRQGAEVEILCQRAPRQRHKQVVYTELPMPLDYQVIIDREVSSAEMIACVRMYLAEIGRALGDGIDLVHSFYGTFTALAGCFCTWLGEVPHVVSTFGRDVNIGAVHDRRYARMLEVTLDACACVMASSEAIAATVAERYGVPAARLRVVPSGVEESVFFRRDRGRCRAETGLDPRETVCLAVQSSFGLDKSLDTLVAAIPDAAERVPNLRVVVVGHDDTPDLRNHRRLTELVESLGVGSRVTFAGHKSHQQVAAYMNAADMIVDPRKSGNFSSCVIEGMAVGACVIASDTAAHSATIRDGENGYLFRAGDARSLASRITQCAGDEHLRGRLRRGASDWWTRHAARYSYTSIAAGVWQAYQEVARGRVAPAASRTTGDPARPPGRVRVAAGQQIAPLRVQSCS